MILFDFKIVSLALEYPPKFQQRRSFSMQITDMWYYYPASHRSSIRRYGSTRAFLRACKRLVRS